MFTLHPQAKAYCPREKKSVGPSRKQATKKKKKKERKKKESRPQDREKVIQKKFLWNFLNRSKEILAGKRL